MTASNFSLSDYLRRINYNGQTRPDLSTLTALMSAQLQSVPFENTEVQAGRIPSLIPEEITTKIIMNGRGGYCYEVNGLFAMALTAIGFEWYFAGARPMFYPSRRPKTHMVVIVTIEGKEYLCDTGFGGYGIREPLEVVDGNITVQNGDTFRFELLNGEYVLYSLVNGEWAPQYGFALVPQEWIEFSLANYFNATHPDTIFTQKKLAVMQTPNGRKILVDDTLKVIENGVIKEESIEYSQALSEYYNLSV
ncbi:arylamine N-acetyltransferase [Sulfuricurvum sp. RIFCSPLOWO2_12_FULL_43_24]|uniref:arylamine N-acetyltransferase family protein n=1 Tax=Sulfuricurvum sp. RIFCSPLOWO2_12_FULL_43_24 TaxID=1802247 RepID=UPI0008BCCC50|nr:arylamine N-acetyltransferase [Sulfuricurvum sp. RIFCSPLOWO2_12_FULL_43_24]OHD79921.1 MAG: acetyltransferase [Sulfuricurvum sp. RIFCSPHIGHO2_02_FULL_43_9]OHD84417.1 MAG: acetyltransferase [Sulfuricurvum sp. RIFCSPHIGHO2_12_FULL_44_8]OHD89104.1 MAG: acetyltransferase [Sulfuricurvum sp. RIFCSPLOWO2_12_FULL_43_24]